MLVEEYAGTPYGTMHDSSGVGTSWVDHCALGSWLWWHHCRSVWVLVTSSAVILNEHWFLGVEYNVIAHYPIIGSHFVENMYFVDLNMRTYRYENIHTYVLAGAHEPPKAAKERPTPHAPPTTSSSPSHLQNFTLYGKRPLRTQL